MSVSFSAGTGLLILGIFFLMLIIPGITDIISDLFNRPIRSVWRRSTKFALVISGLLLVITGLIIIMKAELPTTDATKSASTVFPPRSTDSPATSSVSSSKDSTPSPSPTSSINEERSIATTTPSFNNPQLQSVEVIFTNPGTGIIHLVIENENGVRLEIEIPPRTSQAVYIPSGNYSYRFTEEGAQYTNPPRGNFFVVIPNRVENKQEFCFSALSLEVCSSTDDNNAP